MINLCSSDHEEICYEGGNCPVCVIIEEKNNEITDLKETISELEVRVDQLENE